MAKKEIRPIRIEGNIAYVPLTQGREAVIDADDVPLVAGWNWHVMALSHSAYAARREARPDGKWRTVYMHRTIVGAVAAPTVDHRDGDGLNNRRVNLRPATASENQHNQRLSSANTSGFKGVTWLRDRSRWRANIKINGKSRYLGTFTDIESAAAAYAAASEALHKEFGRIA